MNKRIIIAGGGTGGHIFPAIAIAHALRKNDPACKILFVGAKGKMEMEKVPQAGYEIIGLDIAGFNRNSMLQNLSLPFKMMKSLLQAKEVLTKFNPHVVIGVGGYASFPMLWWAQRKGIPTLIQEQNSFAGKANKILGKKARKICVAYEGMKQFFPADKIILTGNPVRESIVSGMPDRELAIRSFELDPSRFTVLVVGGSLGARSINEAIEAHLSALGSNDLQLIWQTGKPFADRAKTASKGNEAVKTLPFIQHMEQAYAAADLVVSRAGAMAISELCVVKKPVIFVPYPFASEDHQSVNAQYLVNRNAAVMIPDAEVGEKLLPLILSIAKDGTRRELMKKELGSLGIQDADQRIAKEIMTLVA
jgi:UDP-N-acetylglucosamine--N-acetylmuramyl-(pentapeptide) pyrophosphoryl-undecaprenol N-acetylglucosamine transferase